MNTFIKQTFDKEEINKIILDDWVYERTKDDSYPGKDLLPEIYPYDDCHFYGCYLDEIIGLILAHQSEYGPMVHIHMLPDYKRYGFDFAQRCLEQYLHPSYGMVFAEVPDLFPDVLAFTKKLGFIELKRVEESLTLNGETYSGTVLYKDE